MGPAEVMLALSHGWWKGWRGPSLSPMSPATVDRDSTPYWLIWLRDGKVHAAGQLDACGIVGPMLEPFGDWSPGAPWRSLGRRSGVRNPKPTPRDLAPRFEEAVRTAEAESNE
jgi:hypothetical protein